MDAACCYRCCLFHGLCVLGLAKCGQILVKNSWQINAIFTLDRTLYHILCSHNWLTTHSINVTVWNPALQLPGKLTNECTRTIMCVLLLYWYFITSDKLTSVTTKNLFHVPISFLKNNSGTIKTKQNIPTFPASATVCRCFVSELPTIWVNVTEAFLCRAGFFLPTVFFVGPLDFAGDVIVLLSPVLPEGSESFSSFSWSLSCQTHALYSTLHTHTHPFNGPFSGTTQVRRYQKGKTNLDFTEARDSEWKWHHLGHMQVCTSL